MVPVKKNRFGSIPPTKTPCLQQGVFFKFAFNNADMFNKKADPADFIGHLDLLNEYGIHRYKKQTRAEIYDHLP